MNRRLTAIAVDGFPEIHEGDDLAAMLLRHAPELQDGDVLVVTSKIVSKAEGRVVAMTRDDAVVAETARVVARRDRTAIVRTRHGLTLAAAGVDASNTKPGTVVLLPEDPDLSAQRLRADIASRARRNVAVVVSDTAGRPWRLGQTDIAIGCAGMSPYDDHNGRTDPHGNALEVTSPAIADEIAGLGDLVKEKLSGCPVALIRGLGARVLPAGEHGPGAQALIREDEGDMFVLGARDAVLAAVRRDHPSALAALGAQPRNLAEVLDLADAHRLQTRAQGDGAAEVWGADDVATAAALERVCVVAAASGWQVVADGRPDGMCRITVKSLTPST